MPMNNILVSLLLLLSFLSVSTAGVPKNATYFDQKVDHMDPFGKYSLRSYKQRYYTELVHFKGPGHPIFCIMGGESNIEPSTGIVYPFVVKLAETFGGAVIQPEHRFYGESQPIPYSEITKARQSGQEDPRVVLLTSEQALLDANGLIQYYQKQLKCSKDKFSKNYCPVITVGGSYPGFLSAMARLRFPQIVDMAYAGSAPMLFYAQRVGNTAYYDHITKVAEKAYPTCARHVKDTLMEFVEQARALEWPEIPNLGLCDGSLPRYITDTEIFIDELLMVVGYTFANLNMAYYPPSKDTGLYKACELFASDDQTHKLRSFLLNTLSFGNDCFNMLLQLPSGPNATLSAGDWSGVGSGRSGESWDFQTCTLLVETIGFGPESMFPERYWTLHWMYEHCRRRFGVKPQPLALVEDWGFDDLVSQGATKILFTNGLNDGWSVSGIQQNLSDTLIAMNFPNGAHHSDLSGHWPSDRDTPDIQEGFAKITSLLGQWLDDLLGKRVQVHL